MRERTRHIARIVGTDSATAQRLFAEAVRRWRTTGVRVAGVIEETHGLTGRTCNAGVLRDVLTGERHSIFLEILPPGKICHVDASGAEQAGRSVLAGITDSDVVVLSKFGKLEAGGRGLIGAFEAAAAAGSPSSQRWLKSILRHGTPSRPKQRPSRPAWPPLSAGGRQVLRPIGRAGRNSRTSWSCGTRMTARYSTHCLATALGGRDAH